MLNFRAKEWFELKGRGWVAITNAVRSHDRDNVTREIIDEGFTIDGKSYTLLGVERKLPNTRIEPGDGIGLLVKEVPVFDANTPESAP
jgi:hypothetical protein